MSLCALFPSFQDPRSGDMLDSRSTLLQWRGFLRSAFLLGVEGKSHVPGQIHQYRGHLHRGQVALHAVLGGDDWIVAIYAPTGANVFSISGADLERRTVDLLLAVSGDSRAQALPIARDSGLTTTVGLAARTGIASTVIYTHRRQLLCRLDPPNRC